MQDPVLQAAQEAMQLAYSGASSTKVRAYVVVDADDHVYDANGLPIWQSVRIPEEREYFLKRVRGGGVIWGRKLWERLRPAVGDRHMDVVLGSNPAAVLDADPRCQGLKPGEQEPFMAAGAVVDVVDYFYQRSHNGIWVVGGLETFDRAIEHVGEVHVMKLVGTRVPGSSGRPKLLDELGQRFHHLVTKELRVARSRPKVEQSVWSLFPLPANQPKPQKET